MCSIRTSPLPGKKLIAVHPGDAVFFLEQPLGSICVGEHGGPYFYLSLVATLQNLIVVMSCDGDAGVPLPEVAGLCSTIRMPLS